LIVTHYADPQDKIARHWQHDRGGSTPGAWKEDGVAQLQGGRGYTVEESWVPLDIDALLSSDDSAGGTGGNSEDGEAVAASDQTAAEGDVQPLGGLGGGDGEDQFIVPIKKAIIRLQDIAPALPHPVAAADPNASPTTAEAGGDAPGGAALAGWRVPPPTVRCYLVAHPRLDRGQWTDCVQPYVPRSMACHWMMVRGQARSSAPTDADAATATAQEMEEADAQAAAGVDGLSDDGS
jgi:hypothetical protein